MLSVDSGNSVRYYTDATAEGRENYYTGAVADGEPPGRWYGSGAAALGLTGQVRTRDMLGLYERFLDPRDTRFADVSQWDSAPVAGHKGRSYLSEEQVYEAMLAAETAAGLTPDAARRDTLRVEAGRAARQNNAYHDVTLMTLAGSAQGCSAKVLSSGALRLAGFGGLPQAELCGWRSC